MTTTTTAAVSSTSPTTTTNAPSTPPAAAPAMTSFVPESPQQSIQAVINDPPPPYPAPSRRIRRANNRSTNSNHEVPAPVAVLVPSDSEETTPLLRPTGRRGPGAGRPRSASHGSVFSSASGAPSLAQTVVSLFQTEYDSDYDGEDDDDDCRDRAGEREGQRARRRGETLTDVSSDDEDGSRLVRQPTRTHQGHQYTQLPHFTVQDPASPQDEVHPHTHPKSRYLQTRLFSRAFWRRYYHPFTRKHYWIAFFHLLVVNFPFALTAWVYLFVFTLTGTALLITLPIGAILCFLNGIGARTFARGELYLQTKFHKPSLSLYPYGSHNQPQEHPYPLFTRLRPPSAAEIESGVAVAGEMVREESFYRNSYAMFADPTTYQSLFYFLVIKAPITLGLFILTLCVFGPMLILAPLTGPMALRAARRLGRWQAGVAVDGLLPGRRG
ncbi:hypothetical protein PQX77_001211 [Marasmius sp. AFHP31]|nr:hypothetical protein PQX77_001211 [Marasmius sp. AFHP31]